MLKNIPLHQKPKFDIQAPLIYDPLPIGTDGTPALKKPSSCEAQPGAMKKSESMVRALMKKYGV